ncbi:hypothetical protein FB45DRAFT_918379 [Roridomyces roridus]|uniref:Uncharacterized protein n=1 Tax=Roridomyces roridus TaxID=1738132 RepID=A0AAD7FM96_9AGAR|nr:hypothetical protein FB45DRAFT_918379 [Roridomyces roridus]
MANYNRKRSHFQAFPPESAAQIGVAVSEDAHASLRSEFQGQGHRNQLGDNDLPQAPLAIGNTKVLLDSTGRRYLTDPISISFLEYIRRRQADPNGQTLTAKLELYDMINEVHQAGRFPEDEKLRQVKAAIVALRCLMAIDKVIVQKPALESATLVSSSSTTHLCKSPTSSLGTPLAYDAGNPGSDAHDADECVLRKKRPFVHASTFSWGSWLG